VFLFLALAGCEREPLGLVCTPLPPGALAVTELSAADWRWIEIVNPGLAPVDASGVQFWILRQDGRKQGDFWIRDRGPGDRGWFLDPGELKVLGRFPAAIAPTWVDYPYGDEEAVEFPSAGMLEIRNCNDHTLPGEANPALIDRVVWDALPGTGSLAFDGARAPSASANDDPAAWCEDRTLQVFGTGPYDQVLGTPGEVNRVCPTP
jgi:hypothetical protein